MIKIEDIMSFTFTEYFNLSNAKILINNFDKIIEQLPSDRQKKIKEKMREFDPLNAIKKMVKSKTSTNSVKYNYSKSAKTYGRLFAKSVSLQGLPREFRSLLAKDKYEDIDFVNCHCNILEQYCIKKGIQCSVLGHYNNNRNEIINNLNQELGIEKEDAKNLILTILNGGERDGLVSMSSFLKEFKNEMSNIHELITKINPTILKQVKRMYPDDPNINGKVVNRILCDVENNLTLSAVVYLMNKSYNIDCLIFDGFLIRKEEGKVVNQELLDETSTYINETTGYNLKLLKKPFDSIINLDEFMQEEEEEKQDLTKEVTYYKDKEEFEKNHFKIMMPPSYVYIDENGDLYIQHTENLHQSYSHKSTKVLKGNGDKAYIEKTQFTKVWIYDENIRVYDRADFYPNRSKCPSNVYNLFKGFKAESYEPINDMDKVKELVKPIIHQLEVIAQEHYEFLVIYYAFIIQYPELKTNVNIVISGIDGAGKSIINDFFRRKVLGDDLSSQTEDTEDLFSRFSNIFVKKLFIQIDEISKEDFTKKKLEKLKNLTTCSTIKYEKKGFDPITINNYCNTIMTTNNDFTINISQTDRRNVFFKCDDTYAGNHEYWNNFSTHLDKPETARAFYEYLLNYDLSSVIKSFKPESGLQFIRPITNYIKEVKQMCLPIYYRFMSALSNHNHVDFPKDVDENKYSNYKAMELYNLYVNWYDKCHFGGKPYTITKFYMDIKKFDCVEKKRKGDYFCYQVDKNKLKEYLENKSIYDEDAFI